MGLPTDPDERDAYAKRVHAMDNLRAVLDGLSEVLYEHMQSLERQGFSREEAMRMVLSVQDRIIGNYSPDQSSHDGQDL